MKEIGGLSDALKHWRSKKGGTVRANATLIKEIKGGLSDAFKDLQNIIKNKMKDAAKNGTNHINSAPGSRRAGWCLTLGSFSANLEYDYSFDPNDKNKGYDIPIHFWGYDTWDFEFKKSQWYDLPTHLHNFFEELIPGYVAGEGKPFDVTYDFYHTLHVQEGCIIF